MTSWNALSGPAGVPQDIVKKLNTEINAVLQMPDVKERMAGLGMEPMVVTPAQMNEPIHGRHRQVDRRHRQSWHPQAVERTSEGST